MVNLYDERSICITDTELFCIEKVVLALELSYCIFGKHLT